MNPTNRTRILTLRANSTQLNLTPKRVGFKSGVLLKYIIGFTPIWTLFQVNPTRLDSVLDPEGQPNPFEPKNWAQNWIEPENGLSLAALQ